jgi:hypothetical protein
METKTEVGGFCGIKMKTAKRRVKGGVGSNRSRCDVMVDFYKKKKKKKKNGG